jgi:NAD(P)-dependent dehydrogenase (short-subunit alcohol dehydrogenase family)
MGMNVCITDITDVALLAAVHEVNEAAAPNSSILPVTADVSNLNAMIALAAFVRYEFDDVAFLMNNAIIWIDARTWKNALAWNRMVAVNIMGVINGVLAFTPAIVTQRETSLIVNVSSKQGITNPPSSKPAYNMAKAAVINYTESLLHELRNTDGCQTSAHLLIPGWTTTGTREHQLGACLPDQVVDYMRAALEQGEFYILWAAGDITYNRPPLSRWHPNYADTFNSFEVS